MASSQEQINTAATVMNLHHVATELMIRASGNTMAAPSAENIAKDVGAAIKRRLTAKAEAFKG